LVDMPTNIKEYKIPSLSIVAALKKAGKSDIADGSDGVVTFDTQCHVSYGKNFIINALKKSFKREYPSIKIKSVSVHPLNSFPKNFQNYKIADVEISQNALRRNEGTLCVVYKKANGSIRLYFKFKIQAQITLFKAKNNITNGKILSLKDYEPETVNFSRIPSNILKEIGSKKLISRTFIKKGSILTTYMFKKMTLVRKKEPVTAILKEDDGLSLEFSATALSDGDKGDEIKVINKNRKIFKARVVDKGLVEIE